MANVNAIELRGITKRFGSVVANHHVDLSVRKGEILSILGENGSGKTTLMNMISGIYYPDEGQIFVDGKEVTIKDPKDSFALGIGMIHQHFKLVDVFTATENIILGLEGKNILNKAELTKQIKEVIDQYGFDLDPNKKIYQMSVSEKQTVEIVKMLYRGANLLILDEPTAVLTPQETERLFAVLRNMRADGKSIVIITHKLHEVLSLSDRVSVLRKGEYIGTVDTKDATEESLTEMMVGKKVELNIDRSEVLKPALKRLSIRDLCCKNAEGVLTVDHISFDTYAGEIFGIAGVSGSGQRELLEAIAGLHPISSGTVSYYPPAETDKDGVEVEPVIINNKNPEAIRKLGVALSFVPEDRLGMGLVGSMGMSENMMLRSYKVQGKRGFTDRVQPRELATSIKDSLEVVTPGINTPVRQLSGGNVQKVLVGREIANSPAVLMTAYAVRGLDINTSYTIYNLLDQQKRGGVSVIYVGEDLDVLIDLCDRILVMCGGQASGIVDARNTTKNEVGYLMTKHEVKEEH